VLPAAFDTAKAEQAASAAIPVAEACIYIKPRQTIGTKNRLLPHLYTIYDTTSLILCQVAT